MPPLYRAVLFDLCNTIVNFDETRYPTIDMDGTEIRSTAGAVFEALVRVLGEASPGLTAAGFHGIFLHVSAEVGIERDATHREIPSEERFRRILHAAGIPADEKIIRHLVAVHMGHLTGSLVFDERHRPFVEGLSKRMPIGIVSNFDHGPSARAVLARDNLAPLFDPVVISIENGWRKPHPAIFEDALASLGLPAAEVLFVGDTPEADLLGAGAAGMDAVWINPWEMPLPDGVPPPRYTIRDLLDLEDILLP